MVGYPSKVLVLADYQHLHFTEKIPPKIDFVLSCGDVEFTILKEIYERFKKPIFAVKGNQDTTKEFHRRLRPMIL